MLVKESFSIHLRIKLTVLDYAKEEVIPGREKKQRTG